jgi:hypothetical protein
MSEKQYEQKGYKAPSWKLLVIHAILYGIIITIMWIVYAHQDAASFGRTYPWPAWFTTGLGITVVGHLCNVFFDSNRNHEDKYYEKYLYERDH